jgi:hypothetical protein
MKKLALFALLIGVVFLSDASAALTPEELDMSNTIVDITYVFFAMFFVYQVVWAYGYIIRLLEDQS